MANQTAMSKVTRRNKSQVYIHSLDAFTCLRVLVHFCYSSPLASPV